MSRATDGCCGCFHCPSLPRSPRFYIFTLHSQNFTQDFSHRSNIEPVGASLPAESDFWPISDRLLQHNAQLLALFAFQIASKSCRPVPGRSQTDIVSDQLFLPQFSFDLNPVVFRIKLASPVFYNNSFNSTSKTAARAPPCNLWAVAVS